MKKILFIQEYVRMDHVVAHKDGTASIQFKQSRSGQKLKEKLGRIGLNTRDYDVAYMYPKVPEVNKVGFDGKPISYKDPKSTELKPYQSEIAKTIVDGEYDIVIPMGKIGCKYLLGAASITKLRGVPERVTLETEEGNSHEFWTLPMFSMEYVSAAPNVDGLQEADITTLGKYLVQGDKAFLPNIVDYEYVTSMDRVDEIFSFLKKTKPVTAWDLETNTLKSDLPGAKPLVITLAWEEGQGVTIPWDHKDTPFSEADRERITQHTKELLADAATPKVGHNTQYDIHFLMSTKGLTEFESCRDTKIGYYLSVTQEAEDSFRLSDLAYEMTDMGGYDKPLEEWRDNFIKEHARDKEKPVNEVDGSNFNYEWIPLELLHPYAAGDVDCCLRIHNKLYEHIKQDPEWDLLFTNWYPALTRTLARIESNGFKVDIDYLNMIDEKYEEEEARVLEEIREFPGVKELEAQHQALYDMGLQEKAKPVSERDKDIANLTKYKDKLAFNPNSAQDKGRVLYQILNIQLPATKETLKPAGMNKQEKDLTWEDYKTDKFAMNYIVDNVPEHKDLAAKLLEHSSVKTLRNNFTKKLPKMVSPKTGRVHANYNSTGTACVSGDTIITTDKGLVSIESLGTNRTKDTFEDINIDVASASGTERADGFYYSGYNKAIKFTLHDGTELTTSYNHPLLMSNYIKRGHALNRVNKVFKDKHIHNNSWVHADKLTTDNYLLVSLGADVYGNETEIVFDPNKYEPTPTSRTKHAVLPTEMTSEFAEWLGMYMADGSVSEANKTYSIGISNDDPEVTTRFTELSKKVFNLDTRVTITENRVPNYRLSSKHLGDYLKEVIKVPTRAENKDVPDLVMRSTKEVQQAFIRGLSLDSATEKKEYPALYFSSVSKSMMSKLKAMLTNMGIFTNMRDAGVYEENRQTPYSVQITYEYLSKFLTEIGLVEEVKRRRLEEKLNNQKHEIGKRMGVIIEGDKVFVRIRKIEHLDNVELFDLHVPGSHSFVGNGVINHNTSRLSSNSPNQQQLPSGSHNVDKFDYHYPVKRAFVSAFEKGGIIQLDYSALEMRILGLRTMDPAMTQAYLDGLDIHKQTAALAFNTTYDEVTKDERQAAKAIAFGKITIKPK